MSKLHDQRSKFTELGQLNFRALAVAVCLMLVPSSASARILHVFIVADTNDPSIGKNVKSDAGNIHGTFQHFVRDSDLRIYELLGEDVSEGRIKSMIRGKSINRDDAVLFYYGGHGAYSGDKKHILSLRNGKDRIKRSEVMEELSKHNAALTVVITDTCFSSSREERAPSAPSAAAAFDVTHPLFRRLFFQTDGMIDMNACSRGQVAITHRFERVGSIFTASLTNSLARHAQEEDASFGWNELVNEVSDLTARSFREHFPNGCNVPIEDDDFVTQKTQTPYVFTMNIRQAAWSGNSGGNSLTSTRLGAEVTARDGKVFVVSANQNGPAMRLKYGNDNRPWHLDRNDQIVSINGQDIDCVNCFARGVRNSDARMTFVVRGSQDGKLYPFTATLNPVGAGGGGGGGGQANEPKLRFGVWVETYEGPGAKVTQVQPNSPATRVLQESGLEWFLEPGDIITKVNGRETNGQDAVTSAVFASPKEMTVDVIGSRDRKTYRFKVQLWDVN